MSLRIKRHWFREGAARDASASASVIAATVWKASVYGMQNVRKARFTVDVGAPYVAMLDEFLTFQVVAADRVAYRHDDGEWREAFTVALATRLAEIYQENLDHLLGEAPAGGHKRRFIDLLNERMAEFSTLGYEEHAPNAGFLRQFGYRVGDVLTDADDRRWALDQMMSVQAPEALESLESAMRGVLGIDPKPRRRAAGGGD
jgi:hypothetical protein